MLIYRRIAFTRHSSDVIRIAQSQRGSMLLASFAVIALLSMMILFTWRSIFHNQQELERTKLATSRDLVVATALRQSRVATYYYYSITNNDPVNDMLIKCLIDDDLGNDCAVAPGNYSMKLVDFDTATSTYTPVTGTLTNPVYYSYYGQVCAAVSEDCPFEISATFQPTCPAAAATCAAAATIEVTVSVKVNSAFNNDALNLARMISKQTLSITDFQGSYYPILPPTTAIGTPITVGAGPGGFIAAYVGGGGGGSAPSGGGGSAPPTSSAMTVSTCGAGEVKSGTCGGFQF